TLPLYQCLYSDINRILVRELTRKDPLASQVIRDNSGLIRGIPVNLKKHLYSRLENDNLALSVFK
ncbi:18428_t:CDS:2, partial [Entrophospora sp. SA101]